MNEDFSFYMTELLKFLGTVVVFAAAAKGILMLVDRAIRSLKEHEGRRLWEMLLERLGRPVSYLVALWGVSVGLTNTEVDLGKWPHHVLDNTVFILGALVAIKIAYELINTVIDSMTESVTGTADREAKLTVLPLVKKVVVVLVGLGGAVIVLDRFGYNVSSLVAALGVSSLAIGFAAKDTLSNMIAGFVIVADKPFRVGHRIEVDGKIGEVTEIGLRSTHVRTFENTILVYPNSKLVDSVVVNYAYPERSLVYFFKIGVEYGSDVEKTRSVLLEVARSVPEMVNDDDYPAVFFTDHGDFALEFNLLYRMNEYTDRWKVLDKVHTQVDKRFAEEGIVVAFPTRTLHHINAYPGDPSRTDA